MLTPKELQEKTFHKAFRGYSMQDVDELIEPLFDDYTALYKENSVLKSKLKILVEKLEEYRAQELSMKRALVTAQHTADGIIADAQKRAAAILNEAESAVPAPAGRETAAPSRDIQADLDAESQRVAQARAVANDYIASLREAIASHTTQLDRLKALADAASPEQLPGSSVEAAPASAAEKPVVQPQSVPDLTDSIISATQRLAVEDIRKAAEVKEAEQAQIAGLFEQDSSTEIVVTAQEPSEKSSRLINTLFDDNGQLEPGGEFYLPEE